jgi:hypothetical protein
LLTVQQYLLMLPPIVPAPPKYAWMLSHDVFEVVTKYGGDPEVVIEHNSTCTSLNSPFSSVQTVVGLVAT